MGRQERIGDGRRQGPLLEAAKMALVEEEGERKPRSGRLSQPVGGEESFARQEQLQGSGGALAGLQLLGHRVGRASSQELLDALSHQLALVGGHENPLLIIATQETAASLRVIAHGDGQLRLFLGSEGMAGIEPFPQLPGLLRGELGHPELALGVIDQREGEPYANALGLTERILWEVGPQQPFHVGQCGQHQLQGLWLMQAEHRLGRRWDERERVCLADGLGRHDPLG